MNTRTRQPNVRGKRKSARVPARTTKAPQRETSAPLPTFPVHIRAPQVELAAIERDYIRRKLGRKLGKYAGSIERASVRVEDVNGPRGGVDQSCRIKIVLTGLPSIVFEGRNESLNAAVDAALSGVERAARRTLERRRMKPLRRAP